MSEQQQHPGYKVTSALVVAADVTGKLHHKYHGSWIPWLNDVQRAHFLRLKLVEELQAPEAVGLVAAEAAAHDPGKVAAPAAPKAEQTAGKPAKTAPAEKWVDYGVSQGQDRTELEGLSKPELVELLG